MLSFYSEYEKIWYLTKETATIDVLPNETMTDGSKILTRDIHT